MDRKQPLSCWYNQGMGILTDFELLKQQIVDVVTKDPTIKYILVGWMTDEFVPKSDYTKILEELREMRLEIKELREDSNQRFEAMQTDRDTRFKEASADRQALRKVIELLGPRWGRDSELAFRNGLSTLIAEFFDGTVQKWRTNDQRGYVRGRRCDVELDIVMTNGQCIVIEIKSKPSHGDVTVFERTAQFYEQQTGRKPDRKVLIAYAIEQEAKEEALACDIEVFDSDEIT